MNVRTVVVCPECVFVWQVEGIPSRTTCQRCGTSHRFKKLKHYYSSEDSEATRQVRSRIQAKVNGNEEAYQDAKDREVLAEQTAEVVSSEEYLEEMGVDVEEVERAEEEHEKKRPSSKSKKTVMMDALDQLAHPNMSNAVSYCEKRGLDPERTRDRYEKMLMSGDLTRSSSGALRQL